MACASCPGFQVFPKVAFDFDCSARIVMTFVDIVLVANCVNRGLYEAIISLDFSISYGVSLRPLLRSASVFPEGGALMALPLLFKAGSAQNRRHDSHLL